MKIYTILAVLCFLVSIGGKAQTESAHNSRKIRLYTTGGFGVSYFKYDVRKFNHKIHGQSYRFAAPNIRIGIAAEKSISKSLSLKTGLRVGIRIKRTSLYDEQDLYFRYPYSFLDMDEIVSSSNSSFVEIPVGLQWTRKKIKIGISVISRGFAVFTDARDPTDFGIVPSLLYTLNDKVSIGLEYFVGYNEFGRYSVHDDFGKFIYFDYSNRFAQLTVEFRLKKQ